MTKILVIRDKKNHKKIKAFGYTSPTEGNHQPLGDFDTSKFEQVALDRLPDDWEQYAESQTRDFIELLFETENAKNKEDVINILKQPDILAECIYLMISKMSLTLAEYETTKNALIGKKKQ